MKIKITNNNFLNKDKNNPKSISIQKIVVILELGGRKREERKNNKEKN